WVAADPLAFPVLDLAFYNSNRDLLADKGFAFLGDVSEDFKARPGYSAAEILPTFDRWLSGDLGTITAVITHGRIRPKRHLMKHAKTADFEHRRVVFQTEFDDGTWIGTSTADGMAASA